MVRVERFRESIDREGQIPLSESERILVYATNWKDRQVDKAQPFEEVEESPRLDTGSWTCDHFTHDPAWDHAAWTPDNVTPDGDVGYGS